MQNLLHPRTWSFALLFGALLATARIVPAQAMNTAQRGAEVTPFAQATIVSPDWGPTNNLGYTAGIDYTRFIRSAYIQPSLEFRVSRANGTTVNERTYAGGLKLQTLPIHGVHPYATLLVGHGNIDFNYPDFNYNGDSSLIFSYGGGAELNVTSQWKVRLDFTAQHWNLDPQTLTPMTFGVGIAYTLPFHNGQVQ